ncbi:MAG: hypothetical protein A2017_18975 [Lentisphaerae bacterium GWF2_44_16]|nr:MAG: hypothetical protein A2017_18975 [Lentisphaerae bacterium GWF2_44_16]
MKKSNNFIDYNKSVFAILCIIHLLIFSNTNLLSTDTLEPRMIVFLSDISHKEHFTGLKTFGINMLFYDEKTIIRDGVENFLGELKNTQVLTITQKSKSAWRKLTDYDSAREAIRKFVADGGTIFCDYKSASNGNDFLFFLGVCGLPWESSSRANFEDGISADENLIPADLSFRGHGGWNEYIRPFKKLLVMKQHPDTAMLLMQENVNGKGRVIYSNLIEFLLWSKNDKMKKLKEKNVETLLNLIFNKKISQAHE